MKTHQFSVIGTVAAVLFVGAARLLGAGALQVNNHQGVGPLFDLDPAKTYLHKLDFPGDGLGDTINGVAFSAVPAGVGADPVTGNPYSLFIESLTEYNSGGTTLLSDFVYAGARPVGAVETLILGGFVPGTTYDFRLYYMPWGARPQDVTIDTDGAAGAEWSGVMDEDTPSPENYWSIVFQADTPTLTMKLAQQVYNASWHQYGLTTEVVPGPADQPVTITTQPQDQTVREGGVAVLRVVATGSAPMTFQWRKDGIAVPNATNMVLVIPNLPPGKAGSYDVVVNNAVSGDVTSLPAALVVGPSADFTVSKVAGLSVIGVPGRIAQIQVTDQVNQPAPWLPFTTLTLTGNLQIVPEPALNTLPMRFYRGVLQ